MSKKEFGLPERTSITIITVAIAILSVNWFFTYYLPPAGNSLCDETVKIVDWNYDKAGTLNLKLSNLAQAGIVVVDVTANTGNEPQTISVNDVLASGSQTQFFSIPGLGETDQYVSGQVAVKYRSLVNNIERTSICGIAGSIE